MNVNGVIMGTAAGAAATGAAGAAGAGTRRAGAAGATCPDLRDEAWTEAEGVGRDDDGAVGFGFRSEVPPIGVSDLVNEAGS